MLKQCFGFGWVVFCLWWLVVFFFLSVPNNLLQLKLCLHTEVSGQSFWKHISPLDASKNTHLHCIALSVLQTAGHLIWSRHSWLTGSMMAAHLWCDSLENTNRFLHLLSFFTKFYSITAALQHVLLKASYIKDSTALA